MSEKLAAKALPKSLLHPKYWLIWLGFGLLKLIVTLTPYRVLMKLGAGLGRMMETLMPFRVSVAKTNIQCCFGEHWEKIYQSHLISLGKGMFEMPMGWLLPAERLQLSVVHEGVAAVDAAKASGRGILFLGIHTTTLDYGAALINDKYPLHFMYRPAKNPVLDYLVRLSRLRHSAGVIDHHNLRDVFAKLKQGENVWYGCDQDFGNNAKSVFAPFYTMSAYTLPYFAKIAQKTGAAVIPMAGFRDESNQQFVIRYLPEIDVSNLDDYAAATAMNQAIERLIEGYEDQYYWVHRRFKTRPAGEAPIYAPKPSYVRRMKKQQKQQRQQR